MEGRQSGNDHWYHTCYTYCRIASKIHMWRVLEDFSGGLTLGRFETWPTGSKKFPDKSGLAQAMASQEISRAEAEALIDETMHLIVVALINQCLGKRKSSGGSLYTDEQRRSLNSEARLTFCSGRPSGRKSEASQALRQGIMLKQRKHWRRLSLTVNIGAGKSFDTRLFVIRGVLATKSSWSDSADRCLSPHVTR